MRGPWEELERPGPDAVTVDGVELRVGSRVRLQPRPRGDVFDLVLAGRVAVVEAIEQDLDGTVSLAVVVEDDPGRDLGLARQPGHRFFFSPAEVSPLAESSSGACAADQGPRVLVAGIGNIFLADDGFGVALADQLSRRAWPAGVDVVDFGIRGVDLAYAIQDGYGAVILLDAVSRGQPPGTLYVIEADPEERLEASVDAHGLNPVAVIGLVHAMGGTMPRTYVVGCEPQVRLELEDEDIVAELSEPVRAALQQAAVLVEELLFELRGPTHPQEVTHR